MVAEGKVSFEGDDEEFALGDALVTADCLPERDVREMPLVPQSMPAAADSIRDSRPRTSAAKSEGWLLSSPVDP